MKISRRKCLSGLLALSAFAGLASLSACGDRAIHSGDLMLAGHPQALPSDFPPELIYPNAKPQLLGVLDTVGFWSPAQYAVLLQTPDAADAVVAHYLALLKKDNWQVLQSRHFEKEGKTVIVAESFVQQTVTIVVEDTTTARIKLYLKKSSDE